MSERGAAEADADADAGGGVQRRKQEPHSDVGKKKQTNQKNKINTFNKNKNNKTIGNLFLLAWPSARFLCAASLKSSEALLAAQLVPHFCSHGSLLEGVADVKKMLAVI